MKVTALNQTHRDQGAKMVEFAGYDMPVQYPDGMLKEHEWVRGGNVGLFDVSHMGQLILEGAETAKFLSHITPTDFANIPNFLAKYTVLTNENGGIIDDLIITKLSADKFFVVINAGCKEKDIAWIKKNLPSSIKMTILDERSLIAIQGEKAQEVLQSLIAGKNLEDLPYMNMGEFELKSGEKVYISRTGYTGEDGFEVSIVNDKASGFWLKLCENNSVKPIGLGARDSLRLEMGYPLYGHDLDDQTSPIEAALSWVVSKEHKGFIGEKRVLDEKANGVKKKRVGVKLLDRGIAREGSEIRKDGKKIGILSSGGFSPNLKTSIGQGYVESAFAKTGESVAVVVRDREIPAVICSPVFVAAKTKSAKK
ncbi:MAG: Aminomethyltransferase (glycine cleavage system protein) [Rickettsiaceae bacterium]|jgi:aminomethyltransferase|nr:Aminomethyltransferase (glycine cleavage system protein) [Rickettsiaceae bacterium]